MRTTDWILLVFLSVLWGATFFFVAVAVREVPPLTLVLARVSLAALALVPVMLLLGYRPPATWGVWRTFAVLALFNNVMPFTLMFYGQTRIASGLASVLNATTPLFTLVLARVFAGEPLSPGKVVGVLLGIAGVAVLMGTEAMRADASSLIGMVCLLGTAFSYGLAALSMRQLRAVPPLVTAAAQLTASSVMMLPVAAFVDRFWLMQLPGAPTIAAVIALALVSTALAYIVFFRISATAGPANVMLVTLLIPVTATALGTYALGERLALNQIVGALVIASGLVIIDGRFSAWVAKRLRPKGSV